MIRASKLSVLFKNPFYLIRCRFSAIRVARISGISHSFLSSTENRRFYSDSRSLFGFLNKASEQIDTQTASVTEEDYIANPSGLSPHSSTNHPWLEWSKLLEKLRDGGYFDRPGSSAHQDDAFLVSDDDMPEDFLRVAGACLSFARDQSDLLRTLSRRDIEIVVENGSPFLFRNAVDSTRRMKSFLGSYGSNELKFDRACTIDLMHFLLSYAYKPSSTSDESSLSNKAVIESSVRNLLSELATAYKIVLEWDHPESIATRIPNNYGKIPSGNKIEMKRGDWICPRCSFMNFARNIKCRDCDEARPKRELSGGDWECPQCCFFNYARNELCLRCKCKLPGEASFDTSGLSSGVGHFCGKNSNKAEIERMLAANEEKAERWFSKVSQMDSAADLSSSIADKDFPEIMPWRKGSNRFIVSTKKTPLERRLANAQYRRNLGNDGTPEEICFPAAGSRVGPDKANETSITQTLDRILGRSSAVSEMGEDNAAGQNRDVAGMERAKFSSFTYPHNGQTEGGRSYHIQVAPSTAETFAKPQKSKMEEEQMKDKHNLVAARAEEPRDYRFLGYIDSHKQGGSSFGSGNPMNRTNSEEEKHKGMGQTNNSDFEPFVPFPSANYFAKKDRQAKTRTSTESSIKGLYSVSPIPETWECAEEFKAGVSDRVAPVCSNPSGESWTAGLPRESSHNGNVYNDYWKPIENSAHKSDYLQVGNTESWKNDSGKRSFSHTLGSTPQHENPMNSQGNWNKGFSAKSLEGSAVKELDPLDMSEEAKAQRWFRRVAQIKDISELSQIPDEDFPQIIPMRKGVNRFVVSKRKTPLERRLTSPQYKRNLPIVNSDPEKKGNERE